jgi:Spy/CpxP family protein refolding chaperone
LSGIEQALGGIKSPIFVINPAQLQSGYGVSMPAMKQQILTIAAAALLSIPTMSLAEDKPAGDKPAGERPGGPGGRGGRFGGTPEDRVKFLTEKLSLTQEQQDKIKAIYAKNEDTFKAAREAREKGTQLSEEERKKIGEAMKAQNEEVQAVLTPEQKEKMKELRPPGGRRGGDRPGGGAKPEEKK